MVGDIALAHNGDIVNAPKLRQKLQSEGWGFLTTTDSEIIIRMMATELSMAPDPIRAIKNVMKVIDGSYALTILVGDRVFGVRDPLGFRPLCIGRFPEGYALASESAVFDVMGGEFVRDVAPGEIVELNHTGFISTRTFAPTHRAHCMFEWVYFARPDSVMDGKEVYQVRKNLGHLLAQECPVEADVVVAVPDSGRAHALGFAEVSGIPYEEGFMKNRYVERTFIMPEQSLRDEGVLLKLNPIRSTMKGKRVVIVDDSIVRGTTMRKIVQMTRRAGAREVHVRIGCPPIIAPCYYGIDMKTREQFAAINRTYDDIARLITADSVGYTSLKGLGQGAGDRRERPLPGLSQRRVPDQHTGREDALPEAPGRRPAVITFFLPCGQGMEALAAHLFPALRCQFFVVATALGSIVPGLSRLALDEVASGERRDRTGFDALHALAASAGPSGSQRLQRGIGEHADPPHPGAMVRGHQQAALAYPSQTGQGALPSCARIGPHSFSSLTRFEAGMGMARYPRPLQLAADPGGQLVQAEIDHICRCGSCT